MGRIIGASFRDSGVDITTDSLGNIYYIGTYTIPEDVVILDFDPSIGVDNHTSHGGNDIFITKLSSDGTYQWTKTIGGTGDDRAKRIISDNSNNIYVVGSFQGEIDLDPTDGVDNHTGSNFVVKLNGSGEYLWGRSLSLAINSIDVDSSDNLYTTGSFYGYNSDLDPTEEEELHNSQHNDIYFSKFSSSGEYLWSKVMINPGSDYATSIKISGENLYLIGSYSDSSDFDPSEDGEDTHTSNGALDTFITKFKTNGDYLWTKTVGGVYDDFNNSITLDEDGNIYYTGLFKKHNYYTDVDFDPSDGVDNHISNGDYDIFITKLSSNGSYLWTKTIGGVGKEKLGNIIFYEDALYLTGSFTRGVSFDPNNEYNHFISRSGGDLFLLKLDASGEYKWNKVLEGHKYANNSAVATIFNDKIFFVGTVYHGINFDPINYSDYRDVGLWGDIFTWSWSLTPYSCSNISCDIHNHCDTGNNNTDCLCDDGYHLNGNYICIED